MQHDGDQTWTRFCDSYKAPEIMGKAGYLKIGILVLEQADAALHEAVRIEGLFASAGLQVLRSLRAWSAQPLGENNSESKCKIG